MQQNTATKIHQTLSLLMFSSRWVQVPLYIGLIVAQIVYVVMFWEQLIHLISDSFNGTPMKEKDVMLLVLGLIDIVMISNLLIMVIVGGYSTFVSKISINANIDEPDWLDHMNASVLKVKLAMAIITISSVELLRSFINPSLFTSEQIWLQIAIHIAFLLSALAIALCDKILYAPKP